jgi:hypothetical protein
MRKTEEVISNLKAKLPPYVTLDESTYSRFDTPARFIDDIYGEWWATPKSVSKGSKHLKRGYAERNVHNKLTPEEVQSRLPPHIILDISTYKDTHSKARFVDAEHGEFWVKPTSILVRGSNHPKRARQGTTKAHTYSHDHIKSILPKHIVLDFSTYIDAMTAARFIDSEYGEWWVRLNDILHGHGHPNRAYLKTNIEKKFEEEFDLEKFNRPIKDSGIPNRPDFKLSDKIYVNVDGLYWHSDARVSDPLHHKRMRERFDEKGLRLIQFREDEIFHKMPIVKSMVNNMLGKSTRLYARKLNIVDIPSSTAFRFLEDNHLMGSMKGVRHAALVENGVEVMVMSYRVKKNKLVIERLCSKLGYTVVGGLSKLLSYTEDKVKGLYDEVEYWVDLRYGTGASVEPLGFKLEKVTLGWKWTDKFRTYNRLRCRANMDDRKFTEKQHAEELGWYRIYDAGQAKYVKR